MKGGGAVVFVGAVESFARATQRCCFLRKVDGVDCATRGVCAPGRYGVAFGVGHDLLFAANCAWTSFCDIFDATAEDDDSLARLSLSVGHAPLAAGDAVALGVVAPRAVGGRRGDVCAYLSGVSVDPTDRATFAPTIAIQRSTPLTVVAVSAPAGAFPGYAPTAVAAQSPYPTAARVRTPTPSRASPP